MIPRSKKQKTSGSGAFLDQSIEQLNDVTAVSGVNLRVWYYVCFCITSWKKEWWFSSSLTNRI